MLEEYFQRDDVALFIKDLKNNPKYFKMDVVCDTTYQKNIKDELALYLFYDTIFKFQMIVDDIYLFDEFLLQLEKLFRKIDDYDDIVLGIQKLLIRFTSTAMDLHDLENKEEKEKLITHFYQKYLVDGYFIHGFSTTYESFLKGRVLEAEKYPNFYSDMIRVQHIFQKYQTGLFEKDFSEESLSFTDDFIMACYYSVISPQYYYALLNPEGKEEDGYLKHQYSNAISPLKRFMSNHSFSDSDRRSVLGVVKKEWDLLHEVPRRVSLILIPRRSVMDVSADKLKEYLESDLSLEEVIDRILCPKYHDVCVEKSFSSNQVQILSLEDFYPNPVVEEKEDSFDLQDFRIPELMNSNGMISLLLIVGCFFITLGVVFTIIMVLRGM